VSQILVVDDSKVMRDMIVACLRGLPGASFTQASSGLEAIERLSLSHYDAAVLDLNMPDISGLEVLEFVRAQDRLRTAAHHRGDYARGTTTRESGPWLRAHRVS
jgi:two-component system chemotaxis response regulator CheY